jgi:hypothetical protein
MPWWLGPVVAGDAGAVEDEHDVLVVQADVEVGLVERAGEEGRVDRDDRQLAGVGHAGGAGHRVLLGDPDVDHLRRRAGRERQQPGRPRHRGGDGDQLRTFLRELEQRLAERVGPAAGALRTAAARWRRRTPRCRAASSPGRSPPARSPCPSGSGRARAPACPGGRRGAGRARAGRGRDRRRGRGSGPRAPRRTTAGPGASDTAALIASSPAPASRSTAAGGRASGRPGRATSGSGGRCAGRRPARTGG